MNDNKDHLRALLDAYNEVTGFDLPFLPARERALRCLDRLQLTPDDVRAVMRELKRLVESDPKHYPESCLDFRNAIVDTEKFDGRARRLRQRIARKTQKEKAREKVAAATPTVQDAAIRQAAKEEAAKFRQTMGGAE